MALQHTRLTEVAYIASSVASVYANPASTKSHVRGFLVHNTNTTLEAVKIHWVPDSAGSVGTASAGNRIFDIDLQPRESQVFEIPYGLVLTDTNESIQAVTTTASKVTIAVLGDKDD